MALLIEDHPDPEDVAGVGIPGAYGWIGDLTISYSDGRASLTFWIHRSAGAAGSWPGGVRIRPVDRLRISCGDPVPGYPDATFPELDAVMARAATIAAAMLADAGDDEEARALALASIATGGAIRAALYAYLRELVFPEATEVE